jgi:hypothetical protein
LAVEYTWDSNGVHYKLKEVFKRNDNAMKWMVWREWRDETNYPQLDVEWFDTIDEALEKYPGAVIQTSLQLWG